MILSATAVSCREKQIINDGFFAVLHRKRFSDIFETGNLFQSFPKRGNYSVIVLLDNTGGPEKVLLRILDVGRLLP